jgi:sulfite reductase (NADPH) flavoprotein alpha-component
MSNPSIAILWGSETGTSQGLAETAEIKLNAIGMQAQSIDMSDIKMEDLPQYSKILVITSTWGDGDPPSNAMDLLGELQAKKVDLNGTLFSVCALGDTAYYQFCKCGKDFDEALEKHGAKRFYPFQECDIDYDVPFEQWLQGITDFLKSEKSTPV